MWFFLWMSVFGWLATPIQSRNTDGLSEVCYSNDRSASFCIVYVDKVDSARKAGA